MKRPILGVLAVIALFLLGACTSNSSGKPETKPSLQAGAQVQVNGDETTTFAHTPTVVAEPSAYMPVPADFIIEVIVTEKKCFGSAGCNYEYEIDPTYVGTTPLSDDFGFAVIYEVSGGEQSQIGRFTVDKQGKAHISTNVSVSGEDGVDFVATPTRVIEGS